VAWRKDFMLRPISTVSRPKPGGQDERNYAVQQSYRRALICYPWVEQRIGSHLRPKMMGSVNIGRWRGPSAILRYGLAVLAVPTATIFQQFVDNHFAVTPSYFCAVLLTAWFGGLGPGLFAIALSNLALMYYFVPPTRTFVIDAAYIPSLILFSLAALFVTWLSVRERNMVTRVRVERETLRDANQRLEITNEALRIENLERKKAEEALRGSEYKLRQVIETVPSFLWSTAPDGEPTHVNQRTLDYSGMRFEDYLHLGWKEALHPDDFSEMANAFFYAIQTGTSFQNEHRLRRSDGEYRWHQARGEPLRDQQGRIIQWYGLSVDIDDRKKAEEQLRSTQARLARASQMATVAELSASIAHEINQPLAAVISSAQTCQTWLSGSSPDIARARAAVDRIVRDATAAAEVVRHIRALFKQAAPDKSQLQINGVIDEVWRLLRNEMDRRGILGELDLAQMLSPTAADRIQVQQVLLNLMRNGIEAMEGQDDPKRLIVRSRHVDGRIVVEVYDSGPGVADKEKAFEPFHSTKQNGMGVGLAISRSIIQAHEGELWVRDNTPRGALFTFTLPAL
jgi:PAS domain S-box-containing protein